MKTPVRESLEFVEASGTCLVGSGAAGKYLEIQGRYKPGLAPRWESAGQDAMERALIVPATYRTAVLGWRSVAALGSCVLSGACGVCALCSAELSVGLSDVSAGIAKSADAVGRSGV
jgi:hypothetical protein